MEMQQIFFSPNATNNGVAASRPLQRRGFTLIELIIVIAIIAIVYVLGFSAISHTSSEIKKITPENLKETIREQMSPHKNITLICTNKCRTCYAENGEGMPKPLDIKPLLPNLAVYHLNSAGELEKKTYGRFRDEPVCLIIHFYHNGSSDPLILKTDSGIYYLPSFIGSPIKTDSLSQAKALWIAPHSLLRSQGDFY